MYSVKKAHRETARIARIIKVYYLARRFRFTRTIKQQLIRDKIARLTRINREWHRMGCF